MMTGARPQVPQVPQAGVTELHSNGHSKGIGGCKKANIRQGLRHGIIQRGGRRDNQEKIPMSIGGEGLAIMPGDGKRELRANTLARTHGGRVNGKIKGNGTHRQAKVMQHGAARTRDGRYFM